MDYKDRLEKLEEATLSPEQKMKDWHNGFRNENIKACGDAKLKLYYDICVKNNYTRQINMLKTEAKSRGLAWANDVLHRLLVSDLDLDLFKYVRDHSAQDIYRNYYNSGMQAKGWLAFLLYAVVLKQYATIDSLKNEISRFFNISEADMAATMKEAAKDPEILKKLSEFLSIKESLTLTEEKLYEAPEKHDTLNPKLWDIETNTLKPEVKEKIMQIVKDFCDDLENDEIKFNLKDVKLVGSNCSYNYNDKSDLDIHLVMDTKSLKCPDNLYPLLYSAYRSIWNKNHDIDFYGIPVEIFVETDDTEDLNN